MFAFRSSVVPRVTLGKRSLSIVNDGTFTIPVVNFAKFREATSDTDKLQTAREIVSAFKDSGFVYLSNHGIPQGTVRNAFQKSGEFFELPMDIKSALAWEDPRANRGFVQIGRERVTQSNDPAEIATLRERAPDFKESMEIGRDWGSEWKNRWPKENNVPLFKQTMLDFFETCHKLHVEVMRSIAVGLDLTPGFFNDRIDTQCHNLRLLSYPPVKRTLLQGQDQARAGAHSDYGTLTLLFQDSVGGLEVRNPRTGSFVPAVPIPDTIVVNVGDLLARWSNDVLRSTLHRVVAPSFTQVDDLKKSLMPRRQSIAFFCNPNFDVEVACLPNCGKKAKYPPINAGEYIVGRLAATYS